MPTHRPLTAQLLVYGRRHQADRSSEPTHPNVPTFRAPLPATFRAADGCTTPTFGCPDKDMRGYGPTMVELSTRAAQSFAGRHRARRLARPLRRASPLTCTAAAVWLALSGCSDYQEGDSLARTIAEDEAALLSKDLSYPDHMRGAEHLAATWVRKEGVGAGSTVRREAVGWSDRTVGSDQVTIDVRFVVTAAPSKNPFEPRADQTVPATRCYRYLLKLDRHPTYHEIDCPSGPVPALPSASPATRLPDDGHQRLAAVLRTATPDTLAKAVRAAFPEPHIRVDTVTHEGVLVAAVGVPAERDCLLLIRTPSGDIESPGFNKIWLTPGELGCSTGLYLSPPR